MGGETFISCISFIITFYIYFLSIFIEIHQTVLLCYLVTVLGFVLVFQLILKSYKFKIFVRAFLLGVFFNSGLLLASSSFSFRLLGWYISSLTFFHWSEYVITSITNPNNLSLQSFLLDHSREYHIAVISSFIEYALEWILLPSAFSEPCWLSLVGLGIGVSGELLRKVAMLNAGKSFNHQVRNRREEGHELVTTGLYSLCRHPAYVGWFYWCVGNQVMICNPVCAVMYTVCSWFFFRERIIIEEFTLLRFFGSRYEQYKRRVPSGIPFIYGYSPELEAHN